MTDPAPASISTGPLPLADARALVRDSLRAVLELVDGLDGHDLIRPTGCEGWRVAELLVHLRADAEGILTGLGSRTEAPADRDFASYWTDWPPEGPATFAGTRWTCAQAAAYGTEQGLRAHLAEVVGAAARAAGEATPGRVTFQDHVCEVADFLTMWAAELALHQLDLVVDLPGRPGPSGEGLAAVRFTLDALTDGPPLPGWDDATYARKGSGRSPLSAEERVALGTRAARFPAFG